MNTSFKAIASFLFCCLIALTANASHIVGGYMRYKCMGGANYQFTMVLYRDCYSGGSPFDSDFNNSAPFAATVTLYAGNSQLPLQTISLAAPVVEQVQMGPNCSPQPFICYERGTYVFNASLPASNEPIHIVYQRCCRNPTISNVQPPSTIGQTWTISVTPEARTACNTSPVFGNLQMLCSLIGQTFSFDHSATDADGDSLTYEFCSPLVGGGPDQIEYTTPNGVAPDPDMPPPYANIGFIDPPYSASQPIPGQPAFTIDPHTGIVSGTPNVSGKFLYAICVNEYRNGQLLSSTRFEFQHDIGFLTSTGETAMFGRLKVYPNPTNMGFSVELPPTATETQPFDAYLFNVNGQMEASRKAVKGQSLFFSTAELLPGVYQLLLSNGSEFFYERIVVQ